MGRARATAWLAAAMAVVPASRAAAAAPATIADLHVQTMGPRTASLAWTAPSEPGGVGLGGYDVRYATSPIDDGMWDTATQAVGEPVPAPPGANQAFTIDGLASSTVYYFAVKTSDASVPPNVSALSNVVSGKTLPPVLPVTVHNPWLVNDRVADGHNLGTMGATYVKAYTPGGVVDPSSDEDKAINMYNNQKRRLYHWADQPPNVGGFDINDPTYTLNVFGWALCGRHASMACTIAQAAGIGQRKIALPGHWIYEIRYGDGTYHALDTMTTMYVYNKASPRAIASCAQMKADSTLLANAVADGRACPGFLLCGDTVSGYQGMVNSWSDSGSGAVTAAWTGNMDLRLGQSFKRTWEAWQNQHPTPVTDADGGNIPGPDAPYHHECQRDNQDTVNYPYWEPYGQVISYIHTSKATYRRWSNGTDTLAPDFRSAGYQALLHSGTNIATYHTDGITPDLHPGAVNVQGEAVFRIAVPFYITDASFSGTFVKATASDVCKVYSSSNGTSWTQVYDAPVGTTTVTNQNLRTNVFGLWQTWYIKVQVKGAAAKANAGVSNLVVQTIFEHNKGAMAYLDKGVNNITLTFDNAAELQASGNLVHLVYKWKEYSGTTWSVDKSYDAYFTSSPSTFAIAAGGTKVPRTEYILMEVIPPPYDPVPPAPITTLQAGDPQQYKVPLTWTATGDNGPEGTAMQYDLRCSTSPITDEASFAAATPVAGLPLPKASGSAESFLVTGLYGDTTYWFAIQAIDKGTNRSALSNVVSVHTLMPDLTPPNWVCNVLAERSPGGGVDLTWTAPADYGYAGAGPFTCATYDVRYSTSPITEANFASATRVTGVPAPQAPGLTESFTVKGLAGGTGYYFAVKSADGAVPPNVSEISNVASSVASLVGTRTLQAGLDGYAGARDSYIYGGTPTTNYGTNERMTVCGFYDVAGNLSLQRGLVKFDVSSIPVGAALTSARLYLYSYDPAQAKGNTGSYGLYPLTREWTDTQVTWNLAKTGLSWTTAGGDFAPAPDATSPKQAVAGVWYEFDVTSRVQAWLASPSTNLGWIVRCTDENLHNQDRFYQSDTTNAAYRPKLVVSDMIPRLPCDADCSGGVDVVDLLLLIDGFGAVCGVDRAYDPRCDFNNDGSLDVVDLLVLVEYFGT